MSAPKRKRYKKIALALSLCAILLWAFLGTGASLAWFTDTDQEITNIFHFADFDLEVSHRLPDGTWEPVTTETKIFDENAIYEPGYVQVVYLKIDNRGKVPFDFETAVSVADFTVATNYFGQHFHLQDYLRFGLVTADTEEKMDQAVQTRAQAADIATTKLSNYTAKPAELAAESTKYMALIVRMPENVNNRANYRGPVVPKVELGVIIRATQQAN